MSARLRGRVTRLEDRKGFRRGDEWFREQLRQYFALGIDVDAIPAGKAGAVFFEQAGREVF